MTSTATPRNPDFIEALARGLEVIRVFGERPHPRTLRDVSDAAGLARPTARRILITLAEMGYVRYHDGQYTLTPRVLELGMAYIAETEVWQIAEPHLRQLVAVTNESSSIGQLDGSDVVYVARVSVPKLVSLSVSVGTRFPALATSLGKVLLAALDEESLDRALAEPTRSGLSPLWRPDRAEIREELQAVRARGWALTDQQLAPAIRSIAAPIRDGDGRVIAAVNVNTHAAETPVERLVGEFAPALLATASEISADWARRDALPSARA